VCANYTHAFHYIKKVLFTNIQIVTAR
jgi:hypothetical protein